MPARALSLSMLNGPLDDEVMIPFLDALVRSGYQGVCLHPRDGLLVPYNSRLYWERIDRISELARERNLDIWYYDEFPYPSGRAGEMIPQTYPGMRVRTLQFREIDPVPDANGLVEIGPEPLLALLRYTPGPDGEMTGLEDVTNDTGPHFDTWVWGEWHNRFYTGALRVREELHERGSADRYTVMYRPLEHTPGTRLLAVHLITVPGQKSSEGKPDIALPEVTDLFLETIYSRFSQLAEKHGLAGVPVFQDEVTFYSYQPWNREVESRLREVWGDKLLLNLAALHRPAVQDWELLRYQYRAACQDALETNWYSKVTSYCRAHNLRMAGHLPGEESIIGHWQILGNIFRNLSHFDVPGYDIITSYTTDDENRCQATGVKLVQSAAWLAGDKPSMAEVFGAHGFHFDLQKARAVVGWMGMHNIFQLTDHATWSCILGTRKYDAPPIHSRFEPMDVGRPDLWGWQSWFADLMEEYAFDPEVLVLFPLDAMARYQVAEQDLWREEVGLLETFFHYIAAHTQDTIFIPSEVLTEVRPNEHGFTFRGHQFARLIVPPVQSLHELTYAWLEQQANHPGLSWVLPEGAKGIKVFGASLAEGEIKPAQAAVVKSCSEAQLNKEKGGFFNELLASRLADIQCDTTIVKSLRMHAVRHEDRLLTLLNPREYAVEVRLPYAPGNPVPQPPNGETTPARFEDGEWRITIPPKNFAIFVQDGSNSAPQTASNIQSEQLSPVQARYLIEGPNHQSLKEGTVFLAGQSAVPFRPKPVSSIWDLPIPYHLKSEAREYVGLFSLAPLPEPWDFRAEFPVQLATSLTDLLIMIDAESLPPGTVVHWDDTPLKAELRDLYEKNNTVFVIPAEKLVAGTHTIKFTAAVTNGSHGVLERPILVGSFLVESASPLTLRERATELSAWDGNSTWVQWGMPEGYGPVRYEFDFEVDGELAGWALRLPECIGVAEVSLNGEYVGRSSWEPRRVVLPTLRAGRNQVDVRLHGSWNNVFSLLNRVENGLRGTVSLERATTD